MTIKHCLTGYDRATDALLVEHDIPAALLGMAMTLVRVPADDPEAVWCYPMPPEAAETLAAKMGVSVDLVRAEYFLEGFSDGLSVPQPHPRRQERVA